jgi:hypothetical protein
VRPAGRYRRACQITNSARWFRRAPGLAREPLGQCLRHRKGSVVARERSDGSQEMVWYLALDLVAALAASMIERPTASNRCHAFAKPAEKSVMTKTSRRSETLARAMVVAAAIAPLLIACSQSADRDAMSGSSEPLHIVSSTTAGYGDFGVSQRGTNWGSVDSYHTECGGGCKTLAGGS